MYEQLLKEVGLKVTAPRLKILKLLHEQGRHHWTAESLQQALSAQKSKLGLGTVYRVLTQFEACGLVKRYFFENDVSAFELSKLAHHDHFVCLQCGAIEEFVDEIIEQRQAKIAEKLDFEMQDHRLIIYGHCKQCRAK